ncbi:NAD-dependent epimerase/dehydratase family protein [Desulfopila aestuarii]|uniref:Nucleoside-diphosphate-sugar epimerase n=1 Tax=Desulfopila aestuarii DSM 18488 TaxID=1121416 RepID=A0A1M7Y5A8_9BACT|nr:NAD(P)-dependent oxidoreductase [Desulfopila aestuarii]SHO47607.1 Nucleoside-diphosphate-sugar epimerase [Desulfopila aestuarii DSM 18488]
MGEANHKEKGAKLGVVIGGSGLIGGTIVNYFKSRTSAPITVLAPSSKKLSIRESTDIRRYLASTHPDFVINCAIANIDSDSQLSFEVNYLGTLNLARTAAALGIPYIHVSSAATLREGENVTEEEKREISANMTNYAKSKLMAETTLKYMHQHHGLDYTVVRLGVVYGNHDHKIQGFHRMLFSIADESMPCIFTNKNVRHSYSNCRKLPYFIHHALNNREEFSGKSYNFVDEKPINLSHLILTIKSYLQVSTPREIYIPYPVARFGKKVTAVLLRVMRKFGLKATLPPELIFIRHFYTTQTLSTKRLKESSFIDPLPDETVYTRLPDMIIYYLTRWGHQNLISTYNEEIKLDRSIEDDFANRPLQLLETVHLDSTAPFRDILQYDTAKEPDRHPT